MQTVIGQFLRENWVLLVVIGGLVVAWLVLRTPGDDISLAAFDQQVTAGQPVVVELFSNT